MITKFGKRFLTNFIAGNLIFNPKDMALGIATNLEYPLADTNSRLGFEFYRVPITTGGINIDASSSPTTYTVIYSATLPTDIAGKINEVGIYSGNSSSVNLYSSQFLSNFDFQYQWSPTPTTDQDNYRVGDSSLIFTSNNTTAQEYKFDLGSTDISGYSPSDSLSFAYKVNNANLSSLKARLYSSTLNYIEFTFTGHSVGYNLKSVNMSSGVTSGTFDPTSVSTIGIIVTPTSAQASVSVDALRINDEDTFDPESGLIARSILDSTMIKVIGREAAIEFKLDLSFGV